MSDAASKAIQDYYPESAAHCFGCGRLNPDGHRLKTYLEGEETVTRFRPEPGHVAVPGFVYGGLLASLLDCHSTATAAVMAEGAAGRAIGEAPAPRFVTASLHVDFLKPTPLGPELEIRGRVEQLTARKAVVQATIAVAGTVTVRGQAVVVPMPDYMR
jgi:acyl-coenzyme A thioesterase PaaI-like protein